MSAMSKPDLDAARQFLAASGRVLDQRRYQRLFADGDAAAVTNALAAYRNADGGFGHGLEPDGRDPASQPLAIEIALRVLDEADAWAPGLVAGACDWLQANAPADGGAVGVEQTIESWPHAPWWVPEPGRAASVITTGQIAGTLHARGATHPWLDRATELLWSRLDDLAEPGPYDMRGVMRFLDNVPERDRAERALERVAPMLRNVVAVDPDAPGETHSPLDFAPVPASLARDVFDDAVISAHLDHLAAAQRDDGGWMFNWPAWSPAAEQDWRGYLTVSNLVILRANGRLS
jgi:hypothetical protein